MIEKEFTLSEIGFKLSQYVDYRTASEILGISPEDFKGSMWNDIDYTNYLEEIFEHRVKVLNYKIDGFYAMGEHHLVFTEICFKKQKRRYLEIV